MLAEIKSALSECPVDEGVYLIHALTEQAGFFMAKGRLVYMVVNYECLQFQSLVTDYLRLNTDIEITSIKAGQHFPTGRYNALELLPRDGKYSDELLDPFVNLCVAHSNYGGGSSFIQFFHSLVSLFQCPREQEFKNLIGLFGELAFLKYIFYLTGRDISTYWHASGSSDKYDVSIRETNIEIKTSRSSDNLVTIKHSQLFNSDRNYLAKVTLEESPAGRTLNQLIADLRGLEGAFCGFDFALNIEKEKRRVSPVEAGLKKYKVRNISLYDAKEINPLPELPTTVSDLVYKLDVDGKSSIEAKPFVVKLLSC